MNDLKIPDFTVHPTADVQSQHIGAGTVVWQYSVVLPRAVIGTQCNINCHCFIENDVIIGNNVTIKSGVYLWDGLRVADGVFIGPNVTFINDKHPKSKKYPDSFLKTYIEDGASIGAGSVIMGGITIGQNALIGAGSIVTKSVLPNTIVYGSPAHEMLRTNVRLRTGHVSNDQINTIVDQRGNISIIEGLNNIPFEIKRIYYIWGNQDNQQRGGHAHKTLHQFFIAVHGSCWLSIDNGTEKEEYFLGSPESGVLLSPCLWRDIHDFSYDCVLLVLASQLYEESDYIRSYQEYLEYLRNE